MAIVTLVFATFFFSYFFVANFFFFNLVFLIIRILTTLIDFILLKAWTIEFINFAFLAIGAVIGLKVFSKLLNWMFKHKKNLTLAILTGFMIGSLNKIWPWKETLSTRINSEGIEVPVLEKSILPSNFSGDNQLLFSLVLMTVGFALILILEKLGNQKTSDTI